MECRAGLVKRGATSFLQADVLCRWYSGVEETLYGVLGSLDERGVA